MRLSHLHRPSNESCDAPDVEIAGYLEKALAPAHHEVAAAHIAGCRSCAALLMRLHDAEQEFAVANGAPLPAPVAQQILMVRARATAVGSHGLDETAVRDKALRLLTGEEVSVAAPVEPPPPPVPAPKPPAPPAKPLPPVRPGAAAGVTCR